MPSSILAPRAVAHRLEGLSGVGRRAHRSTAAPARDFAVGSAKRRTRHPGLPGLTPDPVARRRRRAPAVSRPARLKNVDPVTTRRAAQDFDKSRGRRLRGGHDDGDGRRRPAPRGAGVRGTPDVEADGSAASRARARTSVCPAVLDPRGSVPRRPARVVLRAGPRPVSHAALPVPRTRSSGFWREAWRGCPAVSQRRSSHRREEIWRARVTGSARAVSMRNRLRDSTMGSTNGSNVVSHRVRR
jgi:hypothetical protein